MRRFKSRLFVREDLFYLNSGSLNSPSCELIKLKADCVWEARVNPGHSNGQFSLNDGGSVPSQSWGSRGEGLTRSGSLPGHVWSGRGGAPRARMGLKKKE